MPMRTFPLLGALWAFVTVAGGAAADEKTRVVTAESGTAPAAPGPDEEEPAPAPPPLHVPYLQYGLSLAGEFVLGRSAVCEDALQAPSCALNSGGGIAIRVGVRSAGRWFIGGAYEFSKQDADKLYRLAILQQARAELRYYLETGRDVEPMAIATAGVAGYGNEWALDTVGLVGSIGLGAEVQISRRAVAGVAVSYRALYLGSFTDTSETFRRAGITSMVGVDLILEARDPLL